MLVDPGECEKCGAELPAVETEEYEETRVACSKCGQAHRVLAYLEIDVWAEEG